MSQPMMPEPQSGLSPRQLTHVLYGLFILALIASPILGAAAFAAIVVAYYKRSDVAGTIYANHFDWMIKTFWWGVLWVGLSALLTVIFIGWITGIAAFVWLIYRFAKGWLALFENHAPTLE